MILHVFSFCTFTMHEFFYFLFVPCLYPNPALYLPAKTKMRFKTIRATNLQNAVSALSHTSIAFGSAGESGSPQQEVNGVKVDESVRKAVEEEAEVMNQLKVLSLL